MQREGSEWCMTIWSPNLGLIPRTKRYDVILLLASWERDYPTIYIYTVYIFTYSPVSYILQRWSPNIRETLVTSSRSSWRQRWPPKKTCRVKHLLALSALENPEKMPGTTKKLLQLVFQPPHCCNFSRVSGWVSCGGAVRKCRSWPQTYLVAETLGGGSGRESEHFCTCAILWNTLLEMVAHVIGHIYWHSCHHLLANIPVE